MISLLQPTDKAMLTACYHDEISASMLYRQLAICTQRAGYFGSQKHFEAEASDELVHAKKISDFVNDCNDEIEIPSIASPEKVEDDDENLKESFRRALDAEVDLRAKYMARYNQTTDVAVKVFLMDMIKIQSEAVGEYLDFMATLERCGNERSALLIFDGKF